MSASSLSCLGHQEFWEPADPSASTLPSWCRGHEDLPHLVRVPGPAGLQKLHPPHYTPSNGYSAARCQPQQSIGYYICMTTLNTVFHSNLTLGDNWELWSSATLCYVPTMLSLRWCLEYIGILVHICATCASSARDKKHHPDNNIFTASSNIRAWLIWIFELNIDIWGKLGVLTEVKISY